MSKSRTRIKIVAVCPCPANLTCKTVSILYMTYYLFTVVGTRFVTKAAIRSWYLTSLKRVVMNTDVINCKYSLAFHIVDRQLHRKTNRQTYRPQPYKKTDAHIYMQASWTIDRYIFLATN